MFWLMYAIQIFSLRSISYVPVFACMYLYVLVCTSVCPHVHVCAYRCLYVPLCVFCICVCICACICVSERSPAFDREGRLPRSSSVLLEGSSREQGVYAYQVGISLPRRLYSIVMVCIEAVGGINSFLLVVTLSGFSSCCPASPSMLLGIRSPLEPPAIGHLRALHS